MAGTGRKNVLAPTTELGDRLTPFHVKRTSEVMVDISETYPIVEWVENEAGNKTKVTRYGLGKPALIRVAQAAGIDFLMDRHGVVGIPTREYMMFATAIRMRLPDGTFVERPGTVEWFYELEVQPLLDEAEQAYEEAQTAQNAQEKKRAFGRYYGKKKQASDVLAKRVRMCETKAMLAAIRGAVPIKSKYTLEELAVPFVVERIDVVPDLEDPHVRELMAGGSVDINPSLYGAVPGQMRSLPQVTAIGAVEEFEDIAFPDVATDEPEEDAGEPEVVVDEETGEYSETPIEWPSGEPVEPKPEKAAEPEPEKVAYEPPMSEEEKVIEDLGLKPIRENDPADYRIKDTWDKKYIGFRLADVEEDAPGFCRVVLKRKLGSQELRDACFDYVEEYLPEVYAEVANTEH